MGLVKVLAVFTLLLVEAAVVRSVANAPGVSFIGVGYNLLKANPDEGDQSRGGIDPGILTTRRILQITWDEKRKTSDQRFSVPDEVYYQARDSCVNNTINDMVTDAKSLQENLKMGVGFSVGGGIPVLSNFAFAANPSYQKKVTKDEKEGKVFKKSTKICNLGAARYRSELAAKNKFDLSEGFRHVVCKLPAKYDKTQYMNFIDKWGTHVITEVDIGVKTVKKIENTVGEMFSFASSNIATGAFKAGGAYQGATASLEFDMANFKKSETTRKWNKGKITDYVVGTAKDPEPIKLVLEEIDHALKEDYWKSGKKQCDLKQRAEAMKKALEEYPKWLRLKLPEQKSLRIPLAWPKGTYALPQTDSRCPAAKDFVWDTGRRTQYTGSSFETKPADVHFPKGSVEKTRVKLMTRYKVTQNFCLRSRAKSASYEMNWPPGSYCIIKLQDCPTREFEKGSITWDDRSESENSGSLPDGDFSTRGQTTVEYCCRDDGIASNAVFLPTEKSFYLLRFGDTCQKVHGMDVTDEEIHWDEPDFSLGSDTTTNGVHPDVTSKRNIELHYCYYQKSGTAKTKAKSLHAGLFKMAKGISNF